MTREQYIEWHQDHYNVPPKEYLLEKFYPKEKKPILESEEYKMHNSEVAELVQKLQDYGLKLVDPTELSNVELDKLISEGKKILIVEVGK